MNYSTPNSVLRAMRTLITLAGQQDAADVLGVHRSQISRRLSGEQPTSILELALLVQHYREARTGLREPAEALANAVAQTMGGLEVVFERSVSTSMQEASVVQQTLGLMNLLAPMLAVTAHARASGELAAEDLRVFVQDADRLRTRLEQVIALQRAELASYDTHRAGL